MNDETLNEELSKTAPPAGEGFSENAEESAKGEVDYEALMRCDIEELKEQFPELTGKESITELEDPIRYAALRDLGLTPSEAYLATSKNRRIPDTRAHLSSAVPRFANVKKGMMSDAELSDAREIFHGLSDSEIRKLYRKVTS